MIINVPFGNAGHGNRIFFIAVQSVAGCGARAHRGTGFIAVIGVVHELVSYGCKSFAAHFTAFFARALGASVFGAGGMQNGFPFPV